MGIFEGNFTYRHNSAISGKNIALIGFMLIAFLGSVNADDIDFSIEAQRMDRALLQFAEAADVQIAFAPLIAMNNSSPSVDGTHTLPQALDLLLDGTGLDYEFVADDFVVVYQQNTSGKSPLSDQRPNASHITQLAQLQKSHSKDTTRTKASTSGTQGQNKNEDSSGIEEVIVTARKREERLQDVPISISAYSAADIEARSLTSLKELAQFAPNFNFTNHGSQGGTVAVMNIRGIGQVDPTISWDPGVGTYMDGVYLGRMQGLNFDLGDLERIEILRGPQGTLFGRNTIGGAVNMVSAKPTDEFEGNGEITLGQYNRIDGKAVINIPLIPGKLAARFAGVTRNRDGHGTRLNFSTGEKIDEMGNIDHLSGRALFDWTVSENFNVLLSIDGTQVRDNGPVRDIMAYNESGLARLLNTFVEPDFGDAFLTDSDFESYANGYNLNELDLWGIGLTMDWDLEKVNFKSITSYRDMKVTNGVDADGSIYRIINQIYQLWQNQFTQEFQIGGLSFDDKLNWIMGLYYFQEKGHDNGATDVYWELLDFVGLNISNNRLIWSDNKSYAVFGQGTYQFTDSLSMTSGLRYTKDKKQITRTNFRQYGGAIISPMDTAAESWGAFSGRLGFEYKWTDDIMTYAAVARGYKSGGINAIGRNENEFVPFNPEYLWSYEVGIRSDWLDNRVRFNSSFFYTDYKDIQVAVREMDENGENLFRIANAAAAEVKGFEMDLVVAPAPGLTLSAAIGHTNGKYTEADPSTGITTGTSFLKVPKWSYSLTGEYSVPVKGWAELIGRVDYVYQTEIHHDYADSPLVVQDGYGLLNARLTLADIDGTWEVSVFGTNLSDEHYLLATAYYLSSLGFAEAQYARPREWGVSLKYSF